MDHKASAAFVAPRPQIQVLTAGGAAKNADTNRQQPHSQQHPKRKRNKKSASKSATVTTLSSSSSSSSSSFSTAEASPRAEIAPQASSAIPFDDFMELEDVGPDDHDDLLPPPNDSHDRDLDLCAANGFQSNDADETGPHKPPKAKPSSAGALSWIDNPNYKSRHDLIWLAACFVGIMASFVCYGLVLEYTTSGGRQLHELSFLFVTSGLYTLTAAAGRHVRDETPSTIPPARFALLALTSMGSTFTSVRSLRYVIYPIQVLAKSCKPVPVMLMGTLMGKRYPLGKYLNVITIVLGVAMFMGG
jgi:UDP-galactose transporter B1